jgi:hypothetical protein
MRSKHMHFKQAMSPKVISPKHDIYIYLEKEKIWQKIKTIPEKLFSL